MKNYFSKYIFKYTKINKKNRNKIKKFNNSYFIISILKTNKLIIFIIDDENKKLRTISHIEDFLINSGRQIYASRPNSHNNYL